MVLPTSDIRSLRCRTHGDREAVARCAECGDFFCRECIQEHDGVMICVQCLAELNKPTEKPRKGNLLRTVTRGAFFVLAVLTSWLFFIFLGKALIWFKGGSEWLETL